MMERDEKEMPLASPSGGPRAAEGGLSPHSAATGALGADTPTAPAAPTEPKPTAAFGVSPIGVGCFGE